MNKTNFNYFLRILKNKSRLQKISPIINIYNKNEIPPKSIIKKNIKNANILVRSYEYKKRDKIIDEIQKIKKTVIIGNTPNLAYRKKTKAIHFPSYQISKIPSWKRKYKNALITCACHNKKEIAKAEKAKADIILLSLVFKSKSYPEKKALGALRASKLIRAVKQDVYALGGINSKNIKILKNSRFSGMAGQNVL